MTNHLLTFLLVTVFAFTTQAFIWHDVKGNKWAQDCNFPGNDLYSIKMPADQCGGKCSSVNECTHWTWTNQNGGTCWLKKGLLYQVHDLGGALCGVMNKNKNIQKYGTTTSMWDCCKPSCSWKGKAPVSAPVATCQKNGWDWIDVNAETACNGGNAFACSYNAPWTINSNLAYGFAAVYIVGQTEQDWCCACYELTFTSHSVNGKKMVVQVINTGEDEGPNNFDIYMPGGGVGIFNACQKQWNSPPDGWGWRFGGVRNRSDCNPVPEVLRNGCYWRFDWFAGTNNPYHTFRRVKCPAELIKRTNCKRNDD